MAPARGTMPNPLRLRQWAIALVAVLAGNALYFWVIVPRLSSRWEHRPFVLGPDLVEDANLNFLAITNSIDGPDDASYDACSLWPSARYVHAVLPFGISSAGLKPRLLCNPVKQVSVTWLETWCAELHFITVHDHLNIFSNRREPQL